VRPEAHRIDLVLALPGDPGLDELLREHVAAEEELVVRLERVERVGERARHLRHVAVRLLEEVVVRRRAGIETARVLDVRFARDRVGDLADEGEGRRLGRRVEDRRRRVGDEEHVGVLDRLPAAHRGPVEAEPVVERRLVERRERQGHVLPGPEQVAELQVDHRDTRLRRPVERVPCIRQRLAAVPQIVPLLDLRPVVTSGSDQQKDPGALLSSEATSPRSEPSPAPHRPRL
jgi:hypothetical protein